MTGRLEGRVAVVTGGARGIGAGIVRRLAAEGAHVAIADLDEAGASALAAATPGATGYAADVTDLAFMSALMGRIRDSCGRLDIVVNNAGITRDKTLRNMTLEDWEAVIRTNLGGVWTGCKASLPHLIEAGATGRLINLSSVSYLGNFGQANYAAAKAGVVGLTRTVALELARYGGTVNAIAPGFIDTPMTRAMPPEAHQRAVASIPMGRIGTPEDIASVAAFLASDDGAYMTGQTLIVDGGRKIGTPLI